MVSQVSLNKTTTRSFTLGRCYTYTAIQLALELLLLDYTIAWSDDTPPNEETLNIALINSTRFNPHVTLQLNIKLHPVPRGSYYLHLTITGAEGDLEKVLKQVKKIYRRLAPPNA